MKKHYQGRQVFIFSFDQYDYGVRFCDAEIMRWIQKRKSTGGGLYIIMLMIIRLGEDRKNLLLVNLMIQKRMLMQSSIT